MSPEVKRRTARVSASCVLASQRGRLSQDSIDRCPESAMAYLVPYPVVAVRKDASRVRGAGEYPSFPPNRASNWQEDPLDLSILLSGGKETNKDSPSNGE